MFTSIRLFSLCFILLTASACQAKETIILETAEGVQHQFNVDVADTYEKQVKGLMFVESMPEDEGMIFLYPKPSLTKFWMKNTLIPLDMLFFNADGDLLYIEHSAEPETLESRGPESAVCSVVELNGGMSKKLGIDFGTILITDLDDKCLHPISEK